MFYLKWRGRRKNKFYSNTPQVLSLCFLVFPLNCYLPWKGSVTNNFDIVTSSLYSSCAISICILKKTFTFWFLEPQFELNCTKMWELVGSYNQWVQLDSGVTGTRIPMLPRFSMCLWSLLLSGEASSALLLLKSNFLPIPSTSFGQ